MTVPTETGELPKGSWTVMIVEDDPEILMMGSKVLEQLGYTVIKVFTPQEAVGFVKQRSTDIDLLLTDVIMPGMNGKELACRLTAVLPTLKVIFMSGYTADLIAQRGVLEPGIVFLPKPFSIRELAMKVHATLTEGDHSFSS